MLGLRKHHTFLEISKKSTILGGIQNLKQYKLLIVLPLLFLCLSFLSCEKQPDPVKSQAVVSLTFQGKGLVKAINTEKQKITMDHEAIKDYMEAMTMDFSVADKSMLNNVKVGDKIEFTLKYEAGINTVTEIRKTQ
jgi:Cu/Ag efflux protein CusF